MKQQGKHLKPAEFYEKMQDPNTIVLDARNDYEYDLGHFRGAVRPDIEAFRELPEWIEENKDMLEGKQILTYCTGGVRCEKFSGWLMKQGFEDVSQLDGGIVTYGKDPEVQGKLWDGQCYVFDERISVPVNRVEHVIVGKDYFTGEPCERYVNCANPSCNKKMICTPENEYKYMRNCDHECRTNPRNLYVQEHNMTEEEVNARLAVIEKKNTLLLNNRKNTSGMRCSFSTRFRFFRLRIPILLAEGLLPFRHHDAGHRMSRYVHASSRHVHDAVNARYNGNAFCRRPYSIGSRQKNNKRA